MRTWAEKRKSGLLCCLLSPLVLAGCSPKAGGATYEVLYPSGHTRSCHVFSDQFAIEGSSYQLQGERADDYKKTFRYNLQILDESGVVAAEYPNIGSDIMCGVLQEDGKLWVGAEYWTSPHYRGYLEGWLEKTGLFLIDLRDGGILFQGEAEENELYLTSDGTRCYFYSPGSEAAERLFGLVEVPARNAEIHYRDSDDWTEKRVLYTFDYTEAPDIDTSGGVETRVRFYISEGQFRVAWTSYEPVGGEKWEYLEKKAYEIPITGNDG
ncbi:MAG: hypothetical protein HFE45_00405 [Oscillospiraceae bacterium]|jgi:hypothetical protein|nr:hypothetical protein [Oscillospiraceae bacterium]